MRTELLTIKGEEGVELDGAFYEASEGKRETSDKCAVYLIHGRSMNFYTGFPRFVPPALTPRGYDCLSLNRRGRSILSITPGWKPEGDAVVMFSHQMSDALAGLEFLKNRGYGRIIVGGHSQGGLLAAALAAQDKAIKGIVLASAIPVYDIIPPWHPKEVVSKVIEEAKVALSEGKEDRMFTIDGWPWVISAKSVLQELDPVHADLKAFMERITVPILSFYGSDGIERQIGEPGKEAFDMSPSRSKRFVIIDGADHFYRGHESRIQQEVVSWMDTQFPNG
jgi:pimeloyl-ACP methyl ester carboxylesterase